MTSNPEQVATLWNAFIRGEQTAFAQILELYYESLYNYGTKLTHDHERVKDGIHDLYLDLWKQRERLAHVVSPKFYMLRVLRYKLLKEQQQTERYITQGLTDDYAFEAEFTIEHQIISEEATQENLYRIRQLLTQLSKRQREAIYLRFYQDLDYSEIAQIMDINHHSVVNLIYEAVRHLRRQWVFELTLLCAFL